MNAHTVKGANTVNTWRDCKACDEDASEGRSIRHYPLHLTETERDQILNRTFKPRLARPKRS